MLEFRMYVRRREPLEPCVGVDFWLARITQGGQDRIRLYDYKQSSWFVTDVHIVPPYTKRGLAYVVVSVHTAECGQPSVLGF